MSDDLSGDNAPSTEDASLPSNTLDGSPSAGSQDHDSISSRKRKSSNASLDITRKHRKPLTYSIAYHELFNAELLDITKPAANEKASGHWDSGRIGLTYWTSEEKASFFTALDRHGRHDCRAISRSISSKSELEVRAFILALQDGYNEEYHRPDRISLLDTSDIPAAFEISEELTETLEANADNLASTQASTEEATERDRYGELYLFNSKTIQEFDPGADLNSHAALTSAMDLLNVKSMIDLSKMIFMNSKNTEENWRSFVTEDIEGPGLYATALMDMYNLVRGIVNRVVSSALFLAQSRRNQQYDKRKIESQLVLKLQDVQAACEILGFSSNRRKYWVGLARRSGVDVYDEFISNPVSVLEVERCLTTGSAPEPEARDHDSGVDTEDSIDLQEIALRYGSPSQESNEEDERAEILDVAQNKEEEARLWSICGKDYESTQIKEEHEETPLLPQRRRDEPIQNWQEKVDYKAEWQLYARHHLDPEAQFMQE